MSRKFYKHNTNEQDVDRQIEQANEHFQNVFAKETNQVMVNTGEIMEALRHNLHELGMMGAEADGETDINRLRAKAFYLHGAVAGMVCLLGALGVYTPERCYEIQRELMRG